MRTMQRDEDLPPVVMPSCQIRKVLAGQKALVTGANSGIGKGVALALGRAGADVVVNYVARPEQAEEVVAEIRHEGGNAYAHQADVSREDQVQAMFARMLDQFGTIDVLVNNAGLQKDARLEEMTLEQWNTVLGVNLTGQFLCAREAVKEFKRRGVRPEVSCAAGKIVCISSVHEVIPWAGHVNYAASKGGVMLMMKSIAQEVAPHRIRVNSVCPGAIRTPINTAAWATPEAYAELMKLVPYKRIGEVEDIGRVVAWLASDEADYITGASIFVDGGMTLYPGFEAGGQSSARALDIGEVPALLEAMIAGLDPSVEVEERAGGKTASRSSRPARQPASTAPASGAADALRRHWPEYLMEAAGLGLFMVSAGLFGTLLFHPGSPAVGALPDPLARQALMGVIMGLTAVGLIYSPWGQQSGAHLNPAVTLTFWRLGKVATWDALFYVLAQFGGGVLGVLAVLAVLGHAFADPPVSYVATVPGPGGELVALLAEAAIAFGLMTMILFATNTPKLMRLTGVFAGCPIALYITFEAPLSGMSMNPARTLASALPGALFEALWIYCLGPIAGMLLAVEGYRLARRTPQVICAKLNHATHRRCIFRCGYAHTGPSGIPHAHD